MDDIAKNILQRAGALNLSVARLCRMAGVPAAWVERLKRRTPKSVVRYVKLLNTLKDIENEQGRNHN
jgi:hypothetical protein